MSGNADTAFVATSSNKSLKAARHDAASGWTAPISLDRSDLPGAAHDIVVDDQGRALAYYATSNDDIVVNRFTPQAGWSGPLLLAETIFNGGGAHLAMDARGNGIIAWAALGGSPFSIARGIVARRYAVDQ